MTAWLERREQVVGHEKYVHWREDNCTSNVAPSRPPRLTSHRYIKMTRFPSIQSVSIENLVSNYGATFFRAAFARFVVLWQNPQITRAHLEQDILDVHIPFTRASVYHRIQFIDENLGTTVDSIRIRPQRFDKKGHAKAGQFETSLVYSGNQDKAGIHGALLFMTDIAISNCN